MYIFMNAFRDSDTARKILRLIEELASGGKRNRIVHVCGIHEDTFTKYGVRSILPSNV